MRIGNFNAKCWTPQINNGAFLESRISFAWPFISDVHARDRGDSTHEQRNIRVIHNSQLWRGGSSFKAILQTKKRYRPCKCTYDKHNCLDRISVKLSPLSLMCFSCQSKMHCAVSSMHCLDFEGPKKIGGKSILERRHKGKLGVSTGWSTNQLLISILRSSNPSTVASQFRSLGNSKKNCSHISIQNIVCMVDCCQMYSWTTLVMVDQFSRRHNCSTLYASDCFVFFCPICPLAFYSSTDCLSRVAYILWYSNLKGSLHPRW